MKVDKKKILFSCVLLIVLIYLISYTYNLINQEDVAPQLTQPELPEWQETEQNFESKKAALDAFKKASETTPPSLYEDHMIDDKGYFNPDYMLQEKHRIIDSIYRSSNFQQNKSKPFEGEGLYHLKDKSHQNNTQETLNNTKNPAETSLEHQKFFSLKPKFKHERIGNIRVRIVGNQVLKKDSRIQLQLAQAVNLQSNSYPKNMSVWGTVSFGPNRVFVSVTHIQHQAITLEAVDLQDGMKGVYIENSFRSEVSTEVVDDVVQDITIPGLPQIGGIKQVFQRNNRKVKVTVLDGYQLVLQPKNQ